MGARVFIYCERGLDGGFWAEPLNAVTNGAFVLAGLAAWAMLLARTETRRSIPLHFLALLMVTIGIGSFLFHTLATRGAAIADVAPIGVFMVFYFVLACSWFIRLPAWGTALATAGFVCLLALSRVLPCPGGVCLNGSVGYLPAFLAMAAIGVLLAVRRHAAAWSLLGAAALFALSLIFRTVDREVCDAVSFGSHFAWHLLNAAVLFVLARAAIRYRS